MANLTGYLQGLQTPDETPDTRKGAPDLFREMGILSPSEKAQQAAQQQQTMQLLQQQLFQQKQQQALQAAQVGTGFGFPVFTAMGGLNQAPKQGPSPQAGQYDQGQVDPSRILPEELSKTPDDRASALKRAGIRIMQNGAQRGDSTMQRIGSNLIVKAQQEAVAQQKAAADKATADRASAQAGNPGSMENFRDAAGNIVTSRQKKNALGGYVGDEEMGRGPNKQSTTTEEDPRTSTQKGAEFQDFQKLLVNSSTAIDSMDSIVTGLKEGAAQGWTASAVTLMDNVVGTLNQLAPGSSLSASAEQAVAKMSGTFKDWAKKTGVNEARWADLVSSLAKTYNPTGTITEKDITRAASTVGNNLSNPSTVASVLEDARDRTSAYVDRSFKYMSPNAADASKPQYQKFQDQYSTSRPKTTAEYDSLPSGAWYYNPTLKKRVKKK